MSKRPGIPDQTPAQRRTMLLTILAAVAIFAAVNIWLLPAQSGGEAACSAASRSPLCWLLP